MQATAAATTSSASTEAPALFVEAQAAWEAKKYSEAEKLLELFIQRSPGKPGYLDAHLKLAQARMAQSHFKESIAPLQYYVRSLGTPENRLLLGEALLRAGSPAAALLTAQSVLNKAHSRGSEAIENAALLLKAQAQCDLDQDSEATKTLDQISRPQASTIFEGALLRVRLRVKECARFPSAKHLTEEQAIDQFERKADCLQDALARFKKATELQQPNQPTLLPGQWIPIKATLSEEAKRLREYAEKPPLPKTGKPHLLYMKELSTLLIGKFDSSRKQWDALVTDAELKQLLGKI